ncbi:BTB/POZ domain-containing protein [Planoprotostelium fungivorum]|uniref:BTB/POZ domain-containing protein n=1 Tax=Planoprotostelium fungivorum TaxID=1890364 RepID=A0A2P6NCS9_9EUKA|nr:BTB/POZ domain-containing protein [Planoprotostelium fungivorum]
MLETEYTNETDADRHSEPNYSRAELNKNITRVFGLFTEAVNNDRSGNQYVAYKMYMDALEQIVPLMKEVDDPITKENYSREINKFMDRVQQLKEIQDKQRRQTQNRLSMQLPSVPQQEYLLSQSVNQNFTIPPKPILDRRASMTLPTPEGKTVRQIETRQKELDERKKLLAQKLVELEARRRNGISYGSNVGDCRGTFIGGTVERYRNGRSTISTENSKIPSWRDRTPFSVDMGELQGSVGYSTHKAVGDLLPEETLFFSDSEDSAFVVDKSAKTGVYLLRSTVMSAGRKGKKRNDRWITINAGGEGTFFNRMLDGDTVERDGLGHYLLDLDPNHFRVVLSYLRLGGKTLVDEKIDPRGVMHAANYLGLNQLAEEMQRLCDERERKEQHLGRKEVCTKLMTSTVEKSLRGQGIDLEDVDLSKLDLRRCNFRMANLAGANLTRATMDESLLQQSDLSHCDMSHASLRGCNLSRANLEGTNLTHCNMEKTGDLRTNLEHANLTNANLTDASLGDIICDIRCLISSSWGVDAGGDVEELRVDQHKVRSDREERVMRDSFLSCDLAGADLTHSTFVGANLQSSNLNGANLQSAFLDVQTVSSRNKGNMFV